MPPRRQSAASARGGSPKSGSSGLSKKAAAEAALNGVQFVNPIAADVSEVDEERQLLFLKVAASKGYPHVEKWFRDEASQMSSSVAANTKELRSIEETKIPIAFDRVEEACEQYRTHRELMVEKLAEVHDMYSLEKHIGKEWLSAFMRNARSYIDTLTAYEHALTDRRTKAEAWTLRGEREQVLAKMERFTKRRKELSERAGREMVNELQTREKEEARLAMAFESCLHEIRDVVSWHVQQPNNAEQAGGEAAGVRRRQLMAILGDAEELRALAIANGENPAVISAWLRGDDDAIAATRKINMTATHPEQRQRHQQQLLLMSSGAAMAAGGGGGGLSGPSEHRDLVTEERRIKALLEEHRRNREERRAHKSTEELGKCKKMAVMASALRNGASLHRQVAARRPQGNSDGVARCDASYAGKKTDDDLAVSSGEKRLPTSSSARKPRPPNEQAEKSCSSWHSLITTNKKKQKEKKTQQSSDAPLVKNASGILCSKSQHDSGGQLSHVDELNRVFDAIDQDSQRSAMTTPTLRTRDAGARHFLNLVGSNPDDDNVYDKEDRGKRELGATQSGGDDSNDNDDDDDDGNHARDSFRRGSERHQGEEEDGGDEQGDFIDDKKVEKDDDFMSGTQLPGAMRLPSLRDSSRYTQSSLFDSVLRMSPGSPDSCNADAERRTRGKVSGAPYRGLEKGSHSNNRSGRSPAKPEVHAKSKRQHTYELSMSTLSAGDTLPPGGGDGAFASTLPLLPRNQLKDLGKAQNPKWNHVKQPGRATPSSGSNSPTKVKSPRRRRRNDGDPSTATTATIATANSSTSSAAVPLGNFALAQVKSAASSMHPAIPKTQKVRKSAMPVRQGPPVPPPITPPTRTHVTAEHLSQLVHSLTSEIAEIDATVASKTQMSTELLAQLQRLKADTAAVLLENVQLEQSKEMLLAQRQPQLPSSTLPAVTSAAAHPHKSNGGGGAVLSIAKSVAANAAAAAAVSPHERNLVPMTNTPTSGAIRAQQQRQQLQQEELDWAVFREEQQEALSDLHTSLHARRGELQIVSRQIDELVGKIQQHDTLLQGVQEYWRKNAAAFKRAHNATVQYQQKQQQHYGAATGGAAAGGGSNDEGSDRRHLPSQMHPLNFGSELGSNDDVEDDDGGIDEHDILSSSDLAQTQSYSHAVKPTRIEKDVMSCLKGDTSSMISSGFEHRVASSSDNSGTLPKPKTAGVPACIATRPLDDSSSIPGGEEDTNCTPIGQPLFPDSATAAAQLRGTYESAFAHMEAVTPLPVNTSLTLDMRRSDTSQQLGSDALMDESPMASDVMGLGTSPWPPQRISAGTSSKDGGSPPNRKDEEEDAHDGKSRDQWGVGSESMEEPVDEEVLLLQEDVEPIHVLQLFSVDEVAEFIYSVFESV